MLRRFATEHHELHEVLPLLRTAADQLALAPDAAAIAALHNAHAALVGRLVPRRRPRRPSSLQAMARTLGSSDAVAPMSRAHAEIGRLTRRLEAHLGAIDEGAELTAERRQDLLACLYGLHTLLELHFLQEEESYFALVTE